MKTATLLLLIAVSLAFAPGAFGEGETFVIDPAASSVQFDLADVLHSVHGTFRVQSGSVEFDRASSKWRA